MVVSIDRIATERYSHGVVTTSLPDTFRVLNPHQPDLLVNRAIATYKQNGRSIEEETGRPRGCDSSDILCMLSCPAPTDGGLPILSMPTDYGASYWDLQNLVQERRL